MPTAEFFRQKAREVRALIALAKTAEVRAQLRLWARELEQDAAKAEATTPPPAHCKSRRHAS